MTEPQPHLNGEPGTLHDNLAWYFNEEELQTLCFDLGVDYENLPARGKAGKARELVLQVVRGGRIPALLDKCRQLRPNIVWEYEPKQIQDGDFSSTPQGDVIDVFDSNTDNYLMTGVISTPACDLDNRKCRELRVLIAHKEPLSEEPVGEQWWRLSVILRNHGQFENYWLNFHRALCLTDKALKPDQQKPKLWEAVLSYDRIYEDVFGKTVRLKPVCRLDDPYRADLLQKFASHAARIGIP